MAATHKLHSARSNPYKIWESQYQHPGTSLSLFSPVAVQTNGANSFKDFVFEQRNIHTD